MTGLLLYKIEYNYVNHIRKVLHATMSYLKKCITPYHCELIATKFRGKIINYRLHSRDMTEGGLFFMSRMETKSAPPSWIYLISETMSFTMCKVVDTTGTFCGSVSVCVNSVVFINPI